MRKFIVIAATVAALFTFTSCELDDPVLAYSHTDICSIDGDRLVSDSGCYYNIVRNESAGHKSLSGFERVVILCDILKCTEGKTDEFDIRLLDAAEVIIDDVVMKSTADEEALGDDAVGLQSAWFSKDWLNVNATYTSFASSTLKHDLAIVLDDVRSNADTVYLTLRHNAYGESYDKTTLVSGINVNGQYFSYPIGQIIPEGTENTVVSISWDWFKTANGTLIKEREISSGCLSWQNQ